MYQYHATIERVVDGDTVDVSIDLGFSISIKERVRLYGIDTPESRTRDLREKRWGKFATARVEELLPVGEKFIATSNAYDSAGKYGRAMFDFMLPSGAMLCRVLLDEHLAVKYHGQNKADIQAGHRANYTILEALYD